MEVQTADKISRAELMPYDKVFQQHLGQVLHPVQE